MLDVGMVLPAIGFAAERIPGVPFDEKARIIANEDGRVVDPATRAVVPNEYVVGWARSGPQGLIGEHKRASAQVVAHMIADGAGLEARALPPREAIDALLRERGVQLVSFQDWKQLDDVEVARGARRGAPRDKIVDVDAMLAILAQEPVAVGGKVRDDPDGGWQPAPLDDCGQVGSTRDPIRNRSEPPSSTWRGQAASCRQQIEKSKTKWLPVL